MDLGLLTYTIFHDLNSPLVTVKTFLGHLEQNLLGSDAGRIEIGAAGTRSFLYTATT